MSLLKKQQTKQTTKTPKQTEAIYKKNKKQLQQK